MVRLSQTTTVVYLEINKSLLQPKRKSFVEIGEIFFWTCPLAFMSAKNKTQGLLSEELRKAIQFGFIAAIDYF